MPLSEKLMYWFSKPVVRSYTGTMLQMDVYRHMIIPAGPKIIAANHPSTTDPFFVASMVGHQSFILINNLLFQVPLLGPYLRFSGHIPVVAGSGAAAMDEALKRLAEGCTVIIFPEGDLSPEKGGFLKPRTGAARLSLASGAPIIPVGIHLNRERVHTVRSTVQGKDEYGRWYLRGPYNLTVGKPLTFHGSLEDHTYVRAVSATIMHHIIELARESEIRMGDFTSLKGLAESL